MTAEQSADGGQNLNVTYEVVDTRYSRAPRSQWRVSIDSVCGIRIKYRTVHWRDVHQYVLG
jgi:hypothetical protein